ncbi:hypothetical protein DCCM_3224 [Desulfocucumis palustris]|uniref:Uncharacterized protein n=1 Tax=Desulfocucumis palustris TaxID=1898651 RepID=A0A2L2XD97_9FIRM|nr:hypothetical protein [Desulfocucumis palustris]GBF34112.1 hypothetical protein DCCM_3224 [Desulfocucumis palustris]
MKKIREQVFRVVGDIMRMSSALNTLAKEHEREGYKVERGLAGVVILKLENGEVHFVPAGSTIKQVLYAYRETA